MGGIYASHFSRAYSDLGLSILSSARIALLVVVIIIVVADIIPPFLRPLGFGCQTILVAVVGVVIVIVGIWRRH